ncbi:hypothetical protein CSB37_03845 [bacterium DOLZORAL124_38_8]|nr:MAG: hypothetical protein CSB37_03845 [bacterium DOLZORAL124_38_8]
MTEKKTVWWREIPALAGTLIGIILTAIGGVMILNVVMKLYVFGFDTPRYGGDFEYQCTYERDMGPRGDEPRVKLSEEKKQACITKHKKRAKKQYIRRQKENLVDALAMLLLGIPFWVVFNRRRKK